MAQRERDGLETGHLGDLAESSAFVAVGGHFLVLQVLGQGKRRPRRGFPAVPDFDGKAGEGQQVMFELPDGFQLIGRLERIGSLETDVPDRVAGFPALAVDEVTGEEDSGPAESGMAVDGHFPLTQSKGEDLDGVEDSLEGSVAVVSPAKVVIKNCPGGSLLFKHFIPEMMKATQLFFFIKSSGS